ncbi:MAG: transcriptional regulator [Chryseobacterium sp. SCN 40-13]|nr:MAG: transcriptional regulator [Chryseobacterium sp. SCN 40-13]
MNTIGLKIKKLREEKGIKQEYMAIELGITQSNYCRLEKSDHRLSVVRLQKIAHILDVQISVFFEEKNNHITHSDFNNNANRNDKEHILLLKEEISSLRKMLEEISK